MHAGFAAADLMAKLGIYQLEHQHGNEIRMWAEMMIMQATAWGGSLPLFQRAPSCYCCCHGLVEAASSLQHDPLPCIQALS